MKDRLQAIINVKAGGRKAVFAREMGWTAQYLQKLLHGAIGITPVQSICTHYPDINARWLLTGEGEMLNVQPSKLMQLLELERYICVMTEDEQRMLADGNVNSENLPAWKEKLNAKNKVINEIFKQAYLHL